MTKPRKPAKLISVQMHEGTWYRLDSPDITECCDCSLVHVTEYMFERGRMFWRSKVDSKATALKRKENRISVVKAK